MTMPREEAKKILDSMPEQVTWDDIMYQFYVKRKLSMSLKAIEAGKVVSHEDAKKKFGLGGWKLAPKIKVGEILEARKGKGLTFSAVPMEGQPKNTHD